MKSLGALIATLVCAALLGAPSGPATAQEPVRVLIVGDSVTIGTAGEYTWRFRLWQHLTRSGVTVDFVGPRNDVYDNVTKREGSQAYLDPDFDRDHAASWGESLVRPHVSIEDLVATYQPDVVVEMLGTNDVAYGWPAATNQQGVRDFAAAARAADPDLKLVMVPLLRTWTPGVTEFNQDLITLASEFNTALAPAVTATLGRGFTSREDTWDGSHPNAQGEIKVAAAVADALAALGVGPAYPRPLPYVKVGPRKPGKLFARVEGDRVKLRWRNPPGATGARVFAKDLTAHTGWEDVSRAVLGNRWTAKRLEGGHRYAFKMLPMKGFLTAANDEWSNQVRVNVGR